MANIEFEDFGLKVRDTMNQLLRVALDEVGASKLVGGSHLSTIGASAFMYNHFR